MNHEHFRCSSISQLHSDADLALIKFYATVSGSVVQTRDIYLVHDGESRCIVDTSSIDDIVLENRESYRFLGEVVGLANGMQDYPDSLYGFPIVRLLFRPVRVDGFDSDVHGKVLSMRDKFISQLDGLIAYAVKHR